MAMQEKMRKLVEESSKKKKEKKKKDKPTKKMIANSSTMGKPGAHSALKTNSIISDSVEDSIASVVSGADLKIPPTGDAQHHPPAAGGKSINMHHMPAGSANALKPPKSKGAYLRWEKSLITALVL